MGLQVSYIAPVREDGERPDERACWLAGLTVGRAEGVERALAALRAELAASGIGGHEAQAAIDAVERRALAA